MYLFYMRVCIHSVCFIAFCNFKAASDPLREEVYGLTLVQILGIGTGLSYLQPTLDFFVPET